MRDVRLEMRSVPPAGANNKNIYHISFHIFHLSLMFKIEGLGKD